MLELAEGGLIFDSCCCCRLFRYLAVAATARFAPTEVCKLKRRKRREEDKKKKQEAQ